MLGDPVDLTKAVLQRDWEALQGMSPADARAYYHARFAQWDREVWVGYEERLELSFVFWMPGLELEPARCPLPNETLSPAGARNGHKGVGTLGMMGFEGCNYK